MKRFILPLFIVLSFFVSSKVFASDIEGIEFENYTISETGYLDIVIGDSVANGCYTLFPNYIAGYEMYSGIYPSKETLMISATSSYTCGIMSGGGYTMEEGYANGTKQTPDGDYWVRFATVGQSYVFSDFSETWYYVRVKKENGVWSAPSSTPDEIPTNSILYHIAPEENSTTTTNTFDIKYAYFVPSSENHLTKIRLNVCPLSYKYEDCQEIIQEVLYYDEVVQNTIELTTDINKKGKYSVTAFLWNGKFNIGCKWWELWCNSSKMITGGGDAWKFNVINESGIESTPNEKAHNDFFVIENPVCEAYDIGCYLKNAFFDTIDWIIYVNDETLTDFADLVLDFKNRIPFCYFWDMPVIYKEAFSNSGNKGMDLTITTPIGPIDIISVSKIESYSITALIKSIFGMIIFFLTSITVVKKISKLFNKEQTNI